MKMKTPVLLTLSFVFFFAACGKEKYTTEPQLKFKSVSPSDKAEKGDIISFTCSFTDEEGDIQDSIIYVVKFHVTPLVTDTSKIKLNPDVIPEGRLGDIQIQFKYGEIDPNFAFLNQVSDDTPVSFGMMIVDRAGHRSNYVESNQIILKK